ncbi:MAG: right-handed parallel beta-helix repeat-containing protein [Candidatus Methanoperedens sp.]|nr:right-handed parallel beta-helix repeat-containing protein [Candidatus Methanoperedens sp.]
MINTIILISLDKINSKPKNVIKLAFITSLLLLICPILASSVLADTNLIVNPGLESGTKTPLNWTFVNQGGNTPLWDNVSHNGSRSIKISISGTTNSISGYPQSDIIDAQPLTTYTASVWGKTQNTGGSNTPAARVVELDANKSWIRQNNILPVFGKGTNDWTQRTVEFRTAANTKYLYVYANIWNGYGDFWMDDVELRLKDAPTPTVMPSLFSYILSTDGNKVYAKNGITEKIDYRGTFKQLLLSTLKPGNHIFIKNGVYKLDTIELPSNVIMECESNNVIIRTSTDNHLIYLESNSKIKGCTFEKIGIKSNIIYIYKNVRNWYVTDNHFINTNDAVLIVNPASGFPINGYGWVLNNTGTQSKLGSIKTGRNITFSNNTFVDYTGDEFFDFNGNAHYNTLENNRFTNVDGYSITDEAIDMLGNNTYNIVKNNYIKANFQRGIRPSRKANHNIIESNYIEYKKGKILNEGGIVLWNSGAVPSEIPSYNMISKNRIIGTTEGITLSGAQYNTITGNKISNSIKGISITKDTYNGANAVSKNNIISNNTIRDIDYGIYISSSPNNVITNNIIKNYKITGIFR